MTPLLAVALCPLFNGLRACFLVASEPHPQMMADHVMLSYRPLAPMRGGGGRAAMGSRILRRVSRAVAATNRIVGSGYSMRLERETRRPSDEETALAEMGVPWPARSPQR